MPSLVIGYFSGRSHTLLCCFNRGACESQGHTRGAFCFVGSPLHASASLIVAPIESSFLSPLMLAGPTRAPLQSHVGMCIENAYASVLDPNLIEVRLGRAFVVAPWETESVSLNGHTCIVVETQNMRL